MVLIGLGFTELSMNPPAIPRVKRLLRQVTTAEARALVGQLLTMPTAAEVVAALQVEMTRRFPELFDFCRGCDLDTPRPNG
jgi:phosphotransferase system enzyme I (PtsI)